MESLTDYPDFFFAILDHAAKAKRLPINKETVQIFWDHIKKYSVSRDVIKSAIDKVIEEGDFLEPGNVIKYIPRNYPEQKPWPEFKDIEVKTEIGKDSLKLIFKQLGDEPYPHRDYYIEMMKLHEKYPRAGFADQARIYINRISTQEEIRNILPGR